MITFRKHIFAIEALRAGAILSQVAHVIHQASRFPSINTCNMRLRGHFVCFLGVIVSTLCFGQTPDLIVEYLRNIPDLSFSYSKFDDMPYKDIHFVKSGKRFSFKWEDPTTGALHMYSYDGERYYRLVDQRLDISRSPDEDQSAAWFNFNPIYNGFIYIGGYTQGFSPDSLASIETIGRIADILSRAKTGSPPNDKIIEFKCDYTQDYPLPSSVYCKGQNGHISKWMVNKFHTIPLKSAPLKIPSKISFEVSDPLGRIVSGSSGTIEIDPSSFKVLNGEVPVNEFRIPISAVGSAYDLDTGVVLKGQDMIRN